MLQIHVNATYLARSTISRAATHSGVTQELGKKQTKPTKTKIKQMEGELGRRHSEEVAFSVGVVSFGVGNLISLACCRYCEAETQKPMSKPITKQSQCQSQCQRWNAMMWNDGVVITRC